ncbi:oxygen-dependent protoporphyrinogen oxidase [Actinokineospora alba]|uniref:Coproporphyrinogen III oxidase n=1 Tax=Actinokineospora alba TaxID=504798 RepID=A0A1H0INR5_9PSEU|nr:protoporphyrinogen oxidase [Actinokineospora alba]TDP70868.1 oxygen-dependent protoporphyrinogen oxidase [Actinokineospora alba]SDI91230.1 oxygen-dependent protoporphyrinogen oxidase [Actinokineospora alba]SDO33003.1 oxygen-dependent protoporphyrinogen oxidase [Actinokineospora alba]
MSAVRVAVIGGGIAGLTAAHRLRVLLGPDAVITVIEQSDRLGGKLRTIDFAGIRYDVGAEAYLARRPEATALIKELGLEVTHPSGARSTVRAGGVTRMIPGGTMLGIPADPAAVAGVLSDEGRDRVAAERTLAPIRLEGSDIGLGALLRSRYGDELPDRLIDPLLGGVYAGSIDNLGLRATMPQIAAALDAGATSLTAAARTVLTPASSAPVSGRVLSPESSALGSERASGLESGRHGAGAVLSSESGALGLERRSGSVSGALGLEQRPGSVSGGAGESGAVLSAGSGAPVFGTLATGLGTLVDRLARDVDVRLGVPVRELTKHPHGWRLVLGAAAPGHEPRESVLDVDAVVVAVPPPAARKLLERVVPVASVGYSRIEVASVGVVALALPVGTDLPGTSGILVGAGERRSDGAPFAVKAFTYSATKWSHLDAVVVRGSVGRFGDPGALRADDEELVRLVRADLFDLTGVTAPPIDSVVTRWGGGLPQYGVGHTALVARIEEAVAAHPGLAVAGAALHGVGIPACIGTGEAAARRVAAHLHTLTLE